MEKIFRSYFKSIKDSKIEESSIVWRQIIANRNNANLKVKLENFRKNNFADGIDNNYRITTKITKKLFRQLSEEIKEKEILKYCSNKNVGNLPSYYKLKNKLIDYNSLMNVKYYLQLKKYVFKNKKINTICEIGGGYGALARLIKSQKKVTYIMIDLPETNLISAYYLKKNFPNKKFFLYEDYKKKLSPKVIGKYDFIILNPWCELGNIKVDLFINITSMMEMNFESVKKYFKIIQKNITKNGFFYNVNRYYHDIVGHPVIFSKYPYDKKWNVLMSEKSWGKNRIHELITQRSYSKKNNIADELKNIEEISKRFTPIWLIAKTRMIRRKLVFYMKNYFFNII